MERKAGYKSRSTASTTNAKDKRIKMMIKQRKESRASKFQNARNLDAQESPRSSAQYPKPVKEALEEKNLKDWQNERKIRLIKEKKMRKPAFVVRRHCPATSATALPIVKNSTYRHVSPRVESRRITTRPDSTFVVHDPTVPVPVPTNFNFHRAEENFGKTTPRCVFLFTAPLLSAERY